MSEYNIADMKYYNEYKQATDERVSIYKYRFREETTLNTQKKINIIDRDKNGFATTILNVAKEYTEDLENGIIKSTESVGKRIPKTTSLKAWLHRKQKEHSFENFIAIDLDYYTGQIYIGGEKLYWIQELTSEENRIAFVNDTFRNVLRNRAAKERDYFFDHDELSVLLKKVSMHPMLKMAKFPYIISSRDGFLIGTLGSNRKPTVDELKTILEQLDKIQAFADEVGRELTEMFRESE